MRDLIEDRGGDKDNGKNDPKLCSVEIIAAGTAREVHRSVTYRLCFAMMKRNYSIELPRGRDWIKRCREGHKGLPHLWVNNINAIDCSL